METVENQGIDSFAVSLKRDFDWLKSEITRIVKLYNNVKNTYISYNSHLQSFDPEISHPWPGDGSFYDIFLQTFKPTLQERRIIIAVLAAYYEAEIFAPFRKLNPATGDHFTEFGGTVYGENREFVPTVKTLAYIFAGWQLYERINFAALFEQGHRLLKENIVQLEYNKEGVTDVWQAIPRPTREFIAKVEGKKYYIPFSNSFPASVLETRLNWKDVVLEDTTLEQLHYLRLWLKYKKEVVENERFGGYVKKGYLCLFYGPPGTGKSLTAALLGKEVNMDVYRIDLSMLVSKYVGETEKNLKYVFDQAENKNWILFFDEADAIFGKRTNTSSSHDRYANQEISYLLQRVEEFKGLVILASNFKANMDEAFIRRIQSMISFPQPERDSRFLLWKKIMPKGFSFEPEINMDKLADKYTVTGAQIVNIYQNCMLSALERNSTVITTDDLAEMLRKEFGKHGKSVPLYQ